MITQSWDHLSDELELLNSCLLREVRRRAQKNSQLDLLQGLVLSEQDVIEILVNPPGSANQINDDTQLNVLDQTLAKWSSEKSESTSLKQLSSLFQLERIEQLCLLLCLAPEIDPRYSRVFAFLQDDVTRKQPGIELALRIFSRDVEESLVTRKIFSSGS